MPFFFGKPRPKGPFPAPTLSQNWPSPLHSKCSNPSCKHPNPPQVAEGTYDCQGVPSGFYCDGYYCVSKMQAQAAEALFRAQWDMEARVGGDTGAGGRCRSPELIHVKQGGRRAFTHPHGHGSGRDSGDSDDFNPSSSYPYSHSHSNSYINTPSSPCTAHTMHYYTTGISSLPETRKELERKRKLEKLEVRREKDLGRMTLGRRDALGKRLGEDIWAVGPRMELGPALPPTMPLPVVPGHASQGGQGQGKGKGVEKGKKVLGGAPERPKRLGPLVRGLYSFQDLEEKYVEDGAKVVSGPSSSAIPATTLATPTTKSKTPTPTLTVAGTTRNRPHHHAPETGHPIISSTGSSTRDRLNVGHPASVKKREVPPPLTLSNPNNHATIAISRRGGAPTAPGYEARYQKRVGDDPSLGYGKRDDRQASSTTRAQVQQPVSKKDHIEASLAAMKREQEMCRTYGGGYHSTPTPGHMDPKKALRVAEEKRRIRHALEREL